MANEKKSGDDLEWDQVFSKGAYCIGGGFIVGCGLSVLTSSTWPVLFSTGVGLGLACINLENQMWNKGKKVSVGFENPWLRAKEKTSEEKTRGVDEKISAGREEKGRSMDVPRPHWRRDSDPVPAVPLDRDRKDEKYLGKDRQETEDPGRGSAVRDYPEKDYKEREGKDPLKDIKPCPRGPKKKAHSQKKEQVQEKKIIEVEADPSLLVD